MKYAIIIFTLLFTAPALSAAKTCTPKEVQTIKSLLIEHAAVSAERAATFLKTRATVTYKGKLLVKLKVDDKVWSHGFMCSSCGNANATRPKKGRHDCQTCANPHEVKDVKEDFIPIDKLQEQGVATIINNHVHVDPRFIALSKKDIERVNSGKKASCESCGTSVFNLDGEVCVSCGTTHAKAKQSYPDLVDVGIRTRTQQVQTVKNASMNPKVLIAGSVLAGTVGSGVWWATRKHDIVGQIGERSWRKDIIIDKFIPVTTSDFRDNIPSRPSVMPINGTGEYSGATNVRGCYDKHHHYIQVSCGTETYYVTETYSCGTSLVSNGNGGSTTVSNTCTRSVPKQRTKYCDESVKKRYCEYDTYKWKKQRVYTEKGINPISAEDMIWPEFDVEYDAHERYRKSSDFKVNINYTFKEESQIHKLDIGELSFISWMENDVAYMEVNNMGSVRSVSQTPKEEE